LKAKGFWFRILDLGSRMSDLGFRVSGSGFWVEGFGLGGSFGCKAKGVMLRV
jgi:hypothetical protein